MMTGYLRQKHDIKVTVRKGNLTSCQPNAVVCQIPWSKNSFYQNEKLIAYSVADIAAVDGHSRYVAETCTLLMKNNTVIYEKL